MASEDYQENKSSPSSTSYSSNDSPFTFYGIPAFNEHGYLPMGTHVCAFDEILSHSTLVANPHRNKLWDGFMAYLNELRKYPPYVRAIYIDGSFCTQKPDPGDIDIVLELPSNPELDTYFQSLPREFKILVLIREKNKIDYGLDVLHWFPEIPQKTKHDLIDFFQSPRPGECKTKGLPASYRKGILKVQL